MTLFINNLRDGLVGWGESFSTHDRAVSEPRVGCIYSLVPTRGGGESLSNCDLRTCREWGVGVGGVLLSRHRMGCIAQLCAVIFLPFPAVKKRRLNDVELDDEASSSLRVCPLIHC